MSPDEVFITRCLRPYLADLLAAEQAAWKQRGAPSDDAIVALAAFLEGGKALRPRFCFWGYAAGTDADPTPDVLAACAGLELLHAFALIHDDLMDGSDVRRGRPALHRALADEHREHAWAGDADQYGAAAALLTGDLAFALASRLAAELPVAGRAVWQELIAELTCGQYLDLAGAARRDRSAELARTVARLKSGRYTVAGPLRLGAALTPGGTLDPALVRFGELVGEAFQLRDDLLGIFGDPAETGKPVGEDLRSAKPTLLLAYASAQAPPERAALLARVGAADLSDDEVAAITASLIDCCARQRVEQRIARDLRSAQRLIQEAQVPEAVREALRTLAHNATHRCG